MEDDYSTTLFLRAIGRHSQETNHRIGIETGYYLRKILPNGREVVERNPDSTAFDKYKKGLSKQPADYVEVIAFIYGKEKELTFEEEDEVRKFNELGEKEYLHKHNLEGCIIRTNRINNLRVAKNDSKQTDKDLISSFTLNIVVQRADRKPFVGWLITNGYEREIPPLHTVSISEITHELENKLGTNLDRPSKDEYEQLKQKDLITTRQFRNVKKLLNLERRGLTKEEIANVIDQTRKKNGKINYTKAGKQLGVTGDTVKRWISYLPLKHLLTSPSPPSS